MERLLISSENQNNKIENAYFSHLQELLLHNIFTKDFNRLVSKSTKLIRLKIDTVA